MGNEMSHAAVTLNGSRALAHLPLQCPGGRMSAVDTGSITTPPAVAGEISRSDMRVIWLLLVAAFVAILNETTMGIAIPHLNADLGIPPELGQWLTSAFLLTMAVVIPTTGFVLQRFTTRQVFIAAMSAFSLGTLVALVAPGFG